MPSVEDSAHLASDAELITSVRAGDRQAFGDLYSRHASAATALARQFARSPAEADDLVSEAFARVLDGLLEGKGPDTAFRAYLFTTLRNTAYDRTRKDKRLQFTDDIESHDQPVDVDDPVIADLENGLVGRAFAGLPERWQTVLWHVQVEGQSPAEVGVLMGMAPNAVSSLAFRAREGLREAYLQAHLAETAAEQCRTTVDRLGAWTRGGLSKRERVQVDAHLEVCDRCPALAAELSEINTSLRGLLAPLLLGGATAGYLSTLGPIAPLVQLGTFTGGATPVGSSPVGAAHGSHSMGAKAAAGKVFGSKAGLALAKIGPWAPGAALASAGAVAAGVVAAVIISLSSGPNAPSFAGDQAPVAVAGSTIAGGAAGANGGGPSNGGPGNGGPGNGGPGNKSAGANGGGAGANGGGAGANGGGPGNGGPGNGGPGNGGGTNGGGGNGSGGGSGSQVPVLPGTTGGSSAISTSPGSGTGRGGFSVPGSTANSSLPGQPPNQFPTPTSTLDAGTTGSTTTGSTTDSATTSSSTTAVSTTSVSTTSVSTTSVSTTSVSTTSASSTPISSTPVSSTTASSTSVPDTPTTPTTSTTSTTSTTATSTSTTPATPAHLSVSASAVSDAVAGGAVIVSMTVLNDGGTVSAAPGQAVQLQVPSGLSIAPVALGSPLRQPSAPSAATAPSCTQSGTDVTCLLPPIAPQASVGVEIALDVSPDTDNGDITVSLNGTVIQGQPLVLAVQPGYASVLLTSPDARPIARAAVNTVTLVATVKAGVADPGQLTFGSPDLTVVGVHGDSGSCTVINGGVTCPAAVARARVTLDVAVSATVTAPPALTAIDQRGRPVDATTDLTVDGTGIGGYRSVHVVSPGHLLRAGSIDAVDLTATTVNAGVVNAGPITVPVALSPGVRIAAGPGAELPAGCVASTDTVTCTPTDRGVLGFALPIQVSAAATGLQQLADATLPAGTGNLTDPADPLTVDPTRSGYDQITLTPSGPLTAGAMGSLTLGTVVGDQVTEPGPVRIARQLADGLLITAATGCGRDGTVYVCAPTAAGDTGATITVAVLPLASADTALAPALLDGDRVQHIAGSLPVAPRAPGQRISLTGPFGGTTIGAPTMRCETPGVDTRNGCPGGLTSIPVSSSTLTVPAGATVISAELTWAATAPAAPPVSTLDTVDVSIDGSEPSAVLGVRPAGVVADATGADPVTSGQLFQRVATIEAQQLLVSDAVPGSHTIAISNLAAKTTAAKISAMGGWSLTVLWSTEATADVGVITDNRGIFSTSTRAGAVTQLEPAGAPVTAIYQTVWAADPWGRKTLAIGGTPVSTDVVGRHGNRLDGFDLLHPALPPGGLSGAITFTNRLTPPAALNPDGVWIGPVLIIRIA